MTVVLDPVQAPVEPVDTWPLPQIAPAATAAGLAAPDALPRSAAVPGALPRPAARVRSLRRPALPALLLRVLAVALLGGFAVGVAIEPTPTGPDPVLPGWAEVLGMLTVIALVVAAAALWRGSRRGLWFAFGASIGLVAQTLACPAVDHHLLAGWWYQQLALFGGLALVSLALAALTRAPEVGR